MTAPSQRVTFRLPSEDATRAQNLLKGTGLSLSAYARLAVQQLVVQGQVPFQIVTPRETGTTSAKEAK